MMGSSSQDSGSREQALRNGHRLLGANPSAAAEQAREMLKIDAADADALYLLGAALRRLDCVDEAKGIEMEAVAASARHPILVEAARAIVSRQLQNAEQLLRPYLRQRPKDAAALRLLAEIAAQLGLFAEAERLLREAIAPAPGFLEARLALATMLFNQNKVGESISILDDILSEQPDHVGTAIAKATMLGQTGAYQEAVEVYEVLIAQAVDDPDLWTSYGHVLKTVGRPEDSLASYRRALAHNPGLGEVWWSIANLKTVRLAGSDIKDMAAALANPDLTDHDRLHLHFALGKALEDAKQFERSFEHYAEGNRLRRALHPYDPALVSDEVRRLKTVFSPAFLEHKRGGGCLAADPIFILGMPRAGSTLIEQILSSHSLIEGTAELPYIPALIQRLLTDRWQTPAPYPELLLDLGQADLQRLGKRYLELARVHRQTDRPFFIDKLPNNWLNLGFIHLILPNARIIDARRHPLGCCFSNFKQQFARGQEFAYSLDDLGRYYRDYVDLAAHFDASLPGRIHRISYEDIIEDFEAEVRRLLDHLGVAFEESCLRFYENERAVRTASSEQVRRPINRSGMDQWIPFEPWLGPLKDALGPVLEYYPSPPPTPSG